MCTMSDKDMGIEDVEETMKQTDDLEQQLELILEQESQQMQQETQLTASGPDHCVLTLLKSVSEVRSDYQQLRRELLEVQALQRELSSRLRAQLRIVHGKFARLRQRLAHAETNGVK